MDAAQTLDYELWMVHETAIVLARGLFGDNPIKKKSGWDVEKIEPKLSDLRFRLLSEVDDDVRAIILAQPFLAFLHRAKSDQKQD